MAELNIIKIHSYRYPFVCFFQTISVDCQNVQAYFSGLDIDPEEAAVSSRIWKMVNHGGAGCGEYFRNFWKGLRDSLKLTFSPMKMGPHRNPGKYHQVGGPFSSQLC